MFHNAKIRWLDSGEPYSEQFQDFYFSSDGGLEETEYVFLKQNNFPQVFIDLANNNTLKNNPNLFRIAETGFGTGLNFLITAMHWLQVANINCILEFTSVEKYPLKQSDLCRIFSIFKQNWPQLSVYCDELLQHYPADFKHKKHQQLHLFHGKIILNLIIDDANSALDNLYNTLTEAEDFKIDAWYLDGFSPARNPEMWNQCLFTHIAGLSRPGTTISTFSSAGKVRRGLQEAGFSIKKVPGLGKKREILAGVKIAT